MSTSRSAMMKATMGAKEQNIVAVDIGGTHARFALARISSEGKVHLGEVVTLATRDYGSFQTAWEAFAARSGDICPSAAAIAVAGPVGPHDDDQQIIRFTNNPWTIQPAQIRQKLGLGALCLVNDFEAVGHAVAVADSEYFLHLAGPDVPFPAAGTLSIVGPGTGLGVAHVWRDGVSREDGGHYRVQSTEGGHSDFAPLDAIDDAIFMRLRQRHRRVSVERVVSGPGIVDIYETLAALEGRVIAALDDKSLWSLALAAEDSLAAAAAERFCLALGSAAGDIALIQGACGVVIAGGLGLRIREMLLASGFASRFCAKGRFEGLMAAMPVKLITQPQPGLFGAAAAFARDFSGMELQA